MKKSDYLWFGGMIAVGAAFMLMGWLCPGLTHGAAIFSTGFSFVFCGALFTARQLYRTAPSRREDYERRLAAEEVELKDERKVMPREKSGQMAYGLSLILLSALNIVFTFAGAARWVILSLWGLAAVQYISGLAIYRWLAKKY